MAAALAVESLSKHETLREVGAELTRLAASNEEGLITAEAVVETAGHPDNVMHGFFTWDDSVAGHQFRLSQARALIRHVQITNPVDLNKPPVPIAVSIMEDRQREGGGYRLTTEVITDKGLLAQLKETAKNELKAWAKRHAMLTDLCEPVLKAAGIDNPSKPKKTERRSKAG